MNKAKVETLLEQWTNLIETGEKRSKEKANNTVGGLSGRIKRTTGTPVIFDSDTFESRSKIQTALCEELPQWSDLIHSQPAIMDGYSWTRKDFIDLYFDHFRMVIERLDRIIRKG